jgi:hypothetical protein
MREVCIWSLLAICILALCCLFVAMFNERLATMEWWLGDEEADERPRGRFAFIRSEWFFYTSAAIFLASAIVILPLLK